MDQEFVRQLREDSQLWVPEWVEQENPTDGDENAEVEDIGGDINYRHEDEEAPPELLADEIVEKLILIEPEVGRKLEEEGDLAAGRGRAAASYLQMYPTRFFFLDRIANATKRFQSKFPRLTYCNTYLNHPPVYGHKYERVSVDYWGGGMRDGRYVGYRGKDIYSVANLDVKRLFNMIFSDPNPPNIFWIIHGGRMWSRGIGWGPSPGGPPGSDARHDHHIHITYL